MRFKIMIADADTQRRALLKNYEKGAVRFILERGLLKFALPMFVFFTLYSYFVIGNNDAITAFKMKYTASICIVGGLFVGTALWINTWRRARNSEPK